MPIAVVPFDKTTRVNSIRGPRQPKEHTQGKARGHSHKTEMVAPRVQIMFGQRETVK
jgi:hypothetical protein